jgi:hypothetical protein
MSWLKESVQLLLSVEVPDCAGGEPAVGCAWGRQGRAKYVLVPRAGRPAVCFVTSQHRMRRHMTYYMYERINI